MYSSAVTAPNAFKRDLHAAWHTSGPPDVATINASALGTGSHLLSEVVMTGGHGELTQEKATVFHLKLYSRNDGLPVGDPTRRERKARRRRGSFPGPARCAQGGKRQLHGAPRLPQPGLSSRRSELRVRAGRGGRSRRAQRARGRHHPGARQAPPPRGEVRRRRARAAWPRPQLHPLRPTPSPRPFPVPQREGRGARSAGVPARRRRSATRAAGGEVGPRRPHLRSTPPSSEALRHSGGERRRCTSATVTLYFEVELRSERRPGTEQKTSLGFTTPPKRLSLLMGMAETALLLDLDRDTGPAETDRRPCVGAEDPAQELPGTSLPPARAGAPACAAAPLFFQP